MNSSVTWLRLLVNAAPEEQLRVADAVSDMGRRADACFLADHEKRLETLALRARHAEGSATRLWNTLCSLLIQLGVDPRDIPEDSTPELRWTDDGLVLQHEAYVLVDGHKVVDPDTETARRETRTTPVTRPKEA